VTVSMDPLTPWEPPMNRDQITAPYPPNGPSVGARMMQGVGHLTMLVLSVLACRGPVDPTQVPDPPDGGPAPSPEVEPDTGKPKSVCCKAWSRRQRRRPGGTQDPPKCELGERRARLPVPGARTDDHRSLRRIRRITGPVGDPPSRRLLGRQSGATTTIDHQKLKPKNLVRGTVRVQNPSPR